LSANFRGNGATPINGCWRQKARVSRLSRDVVCVILFIAVLTQYWRDVTDRQTHNDG